MARGRRWHLWRNLCYLSPGAGAAQVAYGRLAFSAVIAFVLPAPHLRGRDGRDSRWRVACLSVGGGVEVKRRRRSGKLGTKGAVSLARPGQPRAGTVSADGNVM